MAITVFTEFDIIPAFFNQFQQILHQNLIQTLQYDGCLDIQMYSEVEGGSINWISSFPQIFLVVETTQS